MITIKLNLDAKKERVIKKLFPNVEVEFEKILKQWVDDRVLNTFKERKNLTDALNDLDT